VFFNGYKKLESFVFPQYEEIGFAFYRARRMEEKSFLRRDLFHIPFQKRYSITTNRYSIPGFPSLYLGDSTYVCWEEFDRYNFNDLSFIKLVNSRKLTFFPIHRIQDCLSDIERIQEKNEIFPSLKLTALMSYIMTFPIILACTIRVQNKTADFKPEYIIPQLLLEQITKEETIDGIKFLSSKVDYSKIQGVPAYNYVFPPKSVVKDGFCAELLDCFQSTAPTSFGLEKLFSSESKYSFNENEYVGDLEIIEEKQTNYHSTSFGMLEYRLKNRSLKKITDANTRPYNIVR
jgi:hypothetical protein